MADNIEELTLEEEEGETSSILGVEITIDEIRNKIAALSTTGKEDLKGAMGDLKKALLSNPDACNLLLPEEIGEMVKHIYKMTDTKVTEAVAKKAVTKSKKIDLSKVNINDLEDF